MAQSLIFFFIVLIYRENLLPLAAIGGKGFFYIVLALGNRFLNERLGIIQIAFLIRGKGRIVIFPKEEFLERVKLFDEAEKLRTF